MSRFAVVDGLNGALLTPAYVEKSLGAGVAAVHVTINNFGTINPTPSLRQSLNAYAALRASLDKLTEIKIILTKTDLAAAKASNKLGVILGYQNMPGVEKDLGLLRVFHELGVRVIQLSHNWRNLYADGCSEPTNGGLSVVGRRAIEALNDAGISIDLSHTGEASSIETMQRSRHPVAITHANVFSIVQNDRNKTDAVLDALAANGGVIGISYLPPIVHAERQPATVDDVVAHIDYVAQRIGTKHVGLGSDFIEGQPDERYEVFMRQPAVYGVWPWRYAIADVKAQQALLNDLVRRGYSEADVQGIAGDNLTRVFGEAWG